MDVWIQTVILTLYCQGVLTHQNTTHTKLTKQTKEFWPFVLRQLVQNHIYTYTYTTTYKENQMLCMLMCGMIYTCI